MQRKYALKREEVIKLWDALIQEGLSHLFVELIERTGW
jgi:hypothetical protein